MWSAGADTHKSPDGPVQRDPNRCIGAADHEGAQGETYQRECPPTPNEKAGKES